MTEKQSIESDPAANKTQMDANVAEDAEELEHLGIAPSEMKRSFNLWSLVFLSACSSVTWEAISSTIAQALRSGGSSSLVWGYVASAAGAILIVLCHAEYASMIPTAGGQYHYASELSPPKIRRVYAWFAGWITMIGWILSCVAGIFAMATQYQAWAILFAPGYVFERWHTTMITIGLTTFFSAVSLFEIKHLPKLMYIGFLTHVAGYLTTMIWLLVHVEEKNSAKIVFTDFNNQSGWENSGVSWSIGLLSSAIGFVNWDSSIHMAEEMKHVSRDLPRAILANVAVSGIMTFPWIISIAFCITDISGVLSGPVGSMSPMSQLFYNISGGNRAATIGLTCFLPIIGIVSAGPGMISATSRTVWAFSRDGGLPRMFSKVGNRTKVPTNAVILTWALICAVSLINIGNTTALYGISSGCTVALVISYAFPLLMNVLYGFKYCEVPRGHGRFTLGRLHRPVAVAALAWCIYIITFMCFPTYYPVQVASMNWASVVVGGGMLIAVCLWFVYGRTGYVGAMRILESHH
ncbi:Amino acid/polyamine transporter I [Penicillium expansum]|nr:Amino acid/polyamine transporter I [Penicillium expansum]